MDSGVPFLTARAAPAYHAGAFGTPTGEVPIFRPQKVGNEGRRPRASKPSSRSSRACSPLHDRVVVKRVDSETKTSGGIIIPDTAAEKPQQGEVVAVGPGSRDEVGKLIAIELKKGDKVLFGKWSGTEVKIDGQELLIMKESDIMGVLEK